MDPKGVGMLRIEGKRKGMSILLAGVFALTAVGAALAYDAEAGPAHSPQQGVAGKLPTLQGGNPAQVEAGTTVNELRNNAFTDGDTVSKRRALVIGRVESVKGQVLTVQTLDGKKLVRLHADSRVRKCGGVRAVKAGDPVLIRGRIAKDGTIVARRVRVFSERPKPCIRLRKQALGASSRFLGLSPNALKAKLREGKSLATIAGPERTPALVETLIKAARERVGHARANGWLTDAQAERIMRNLPDRITRLVHREWHKG